MALGATMTLGTIPAYALEIVPPEIELNALDVLDVLPASETPAAVPSATPTVETGGLLPGPADVLPDPDEVTGDAGGVVSPLLDPLTGLLPGGGDPESSGPGGGGPQPQTITDPDGGNGTSGGSSTGVAGSTAGPGGTGSARDRDDSIARDAIATATILHAAGRALRLAGPLAVPLIFAIGAVGFLIAVSARPARLLKGDRLPFRRSYRI